LVLDTAEGREIVEVKLTTSPSPSDFERLAGVAELIDATRQVLISRVGKSTTTGQRWSTTLAAYLKATDARRIKPPARSRAARRKR
jgi:hypothetical protein